MAAVTDSPADSGPEESTPRKSLKRSVVLFAVIAVFAGVVLAKLVIPKTDLPAASGASLTTVHNDAVADYDAARKTGRPIYILFHSLS